MGSGASKDGGKQNSAKPKPTTVVVKRGSAIEGKEGQFVKRGSNFEGKVVDSHGRTSVKMRSGSVKTDPGPGAVRQLDKKRGSTTRGDEKTVEDSRPSSIRAMRGSSNKRASFTDPDGESGKNAPNRTSRPSLTGTGRTSVISVQRPGTLPVQRPDSHAAGTLSAVKVSRSMDVRSLSTQHELRQSSFVEGKMRKSRKEPSRNSLQMMHQSRQSVISLQDPNAPDVKRRMQLEEQIKRERLNKKMKSIVTVQLLRKMLDDDPGIKLRESVQSKINSSLSENHISNLSTLLQKAETNSAAVSELQAGVREINSSKRMKFAENFKEPKVIKLAEQKAEIPKASAMLSEGRVAFQIFGADYGSDLLLATNVPESNKLALMESDPWAICRALGSVDSQRYLINSKTSTSGATLLGRHLLQLSMVLTNVGNQARVNAVILIHCQNEFVDRLTNDLLTHSHYGFLKENVVVIPTPAMASYAWKGDKLAVKAGLSKTYYGNGYGILQLSWPGQGMLVINNEQRRSRIGPPLLNYLDDHGIQMIACSNINDMDKLMIPGALNMKLLSIVNQAFNEHVDKADQVANIFLEVTKTVTNAVEADHVIFSNGANRVLSGACMSDTLRKKITSGPNTGEFSPTLSCNRWYCSLRTLETKIIPALSKVDLRLTVGNTAEGDGLGVNFNIEDLTLDEESFGLRLELIEFAQASVTFRNESDVDTVVAVLKEQDENQDFLNMGVKCNFGKKQANALAASIFIKPRVSAILSINDPAAIRPLRFLETIINKKLDKITLANIIEPKEIIKESLARSSFEQFKSWSPDINVQDLMIVRSEEEGHVKTLCKYAEYEGCDLIACGSKALNPDNVESSAVVELLNETNKSLLIAKSGIRVKNLLENGTGSTPSSPTFRQASVQTTHLSLSILVDDQYFNQCLDYSLQFFNKEKDTLSLLRLTKRADLPDQTLGHYRIVQQSEESCCRAGVYVYTCMKDSSGDGTGDIADFVIKEDVGLLVVALPRGTVSDFVKQLLIKVSCPILLIRP